MSTLRAVLSLLLLSSTAHAAVTVDYRNHDSQERVFSGKCSGSSASITFEGNTTSAATLQGSAPCVLQTPKGEVTLTGGEKVIIRNGEIEIE